MNFKRVLGTIALTISIALTSCGSPSSHHTSPITKMGKPSGGSKPMSRVWMSGFEAQSQGFAEWDSGLGGSQTLDQTTKHAGLCSLRCGGIDTAQSNLFTAQTEMYVRWYVYFDVAGVAVGSPSLFAGLQAGSTFKVDLQLNADGTVSIINTAGGGTNIGTSTTALSGGQWYRIELHYRVSATTGLGELKINGVTEISATCNDPGASSITRVSCGYDVYPGIDCLYDDCAVNSTAGTVNNSWPGEGGIVLIKPGSDTATINWTPSTGTDHFALIDEFPGDPLSDSVFTISNTLNLEDRWNFTNLPSETDSATAILAIAFGVRGGGDGTQTRTAKFQARDGSDNTVDGTDVDWNLNGQKTIYPILIQDQTWEGSPATLTVAYINGVQGAAIETNSNVRRIEWTVVWASVEYTPVGAAPPSSSTAHRLSLMGVGH